MKRFCAFAVMAVMGLGIVGCGADLPSEDEIDPNPQADPAQVQNAMQEMMERQQAAAKGRATTQADAGEMANQTTGGN